MVCEEGLNEIIARNSSGMREMCKVRTGPPTDAAPSLFDANACCNATRDILSTLHHHVLLCISKIYCTSSLDASQAEDVTMLLLVSPRVTVASITPCFLCPLTCLLN